MKTFTIAAAQSSSIKGDISENIRRHAGLVRLATEHGAEVIVFPELSLTGYEPTIAREVALTADADDLRPLKELADDLRVTIIAGCPIQSTYNKPFIGAVILRPSQSIGVYRKRFLHPGEKQHFIPSNDMLVYSSHGQSIGVAICADIDHPTHPADLRKQNATIYAAGVMMTPRGIADAEEKMSNYAKKHHMLAVMANHA